MISIQVALTGHTSVLGSIIKKYFESQSCNVIGISRSTGYDLRDYSAVGLMLDAVQDTSLFINCAKPDYAQAQILYRLIKSNYQGKILSIGSPVVHNMPSWSDLGLLEYATQKSALFHAHSVLSRLYPNKFLMWEPQHSFDEQYVTQSLKELGF